MNVKSYTESPTTWIDLSEGNTAITIKPNQLIIRRLSAKFTVLRRCAGIFRDEVFPDLAILGRFRNARDGGEENSNMAGSGFFSEFPPMESGW